MARRATGSNETVAFRSEGRKKERQSRRSSLPEKEKKREETPSISFPSRPQSEGSARRKKLSDDKKKGGGRAYSTSPV